jgi:hypothetical protein
MFIIEKSFFKDNIKGRLKKIQPYLAFTSKNRHVDYLDWKEWSSFQ